MASMTRRALREHILKLLYLRDFHDAEEFDEQFELYIGNFTDLEDASELRARFNDITDHLAEIDKMIEDKTLALLEMKRLDANIINEKISNQIVHLQDVTDKIVARVVENPSKKKQVRRFFNYYLPTTIKLLNAYDRMDEAGIAGINIDGTKGKIEEMMETAVDAYDKQLDYLYKDEALDISTDITVMENLMKSEGLTEK